MREFVAKGDGKKVSTAREVDTKKSGSYSAGPNLSLRVKPTGSRSWVFRYQSNGKIVEIGVGKAGKHDVGLAEARDIADSMRTAIRNGVDPKSVIKPKHDATAKTFKSYAEEVIKAKQQEFSNAKHLKQWSSTLEAYCYGSNRGVPDLGGMHPRDITYFDVKAVLDQKALKNADGKLKRETVSRLRQRIAVILDEAARAEGEPHRYNPAKSIKSAKRKKGEGVKHHAAAHYEDVPTIMASLRQKDATSAMLLRFSILTAARSGEARGALWSEIDREANLWVIPEARMKAGRIHMVPLSAEALAILKTMERRKHPKAPDSIFPGQRGGLLSDVAVAKVLKSVWAGVTAHGFRSSFRDWIADKTEFDSAAAEWALAHGPKSITVGAYQRLSLLDKRKVIMASWAKYLAGVES